MSLKYNWIDRQNGVDNVDAEDINKVARAVIEIEKRLDDGGIGESGTTFFPSVSEIGIISWTNDGGLQNPPPINIKGDRGEKGEKGEKGDPTDVQQTTGQSTTAVMSQKAATDLFALKSDLSTLSLGVHTDGLIHIFMNGVPVGDGVEIGAGGDVVGYVDSENNIVIRGSLPDGTYTIQYEMEDGSSIDIGNLVLDTNVYYTVTNNLTNCTSSNSETRIVSGNAYSATISANDGYTLSSIVVTMGGVDITSSAVSGGAISIASVSGNIVITAVAEEVKADEPITVDIELTDNLRIGSDGTDRIQAGYCATPHIDLTNIPKPCTIHLTKAFWCDNSKGSTMVRVHAANASGTKLINDITSEGVGGNYFTVVDNSGGTGSNITVTVTSAAVATIRFSGYWAKVGVSDSTNSFAKAGTKATLTYTPN